MGNADEGHLRRGSIASCAITHGRNSRLRWMGLSRGANDTGMVNLLFEFERQACIDVYSVLIAAGVELTKSGHLCFTELCQCTRSQRRDCGEEIASVDLEIQTYPPEMLASSHSLPSI